MEEKKETTQVFLTFHNFCWLYAGPIRALFAVTTVICSVPILGYLYGVIQISCLILKGSHFPFVQ